MKTSIASCPLVIACAGLSIAAVMLGLASCAADHLGSQEVAGLAEAAPTMDTMLDNARRPCTGHQSHTLFLQGTDGKTFELVYVRGCGWKQVAAGKPTDDSLALRGMSFSPVPASQAETTTANTDPMAIFIDGPTGYTFAWTGDTGWKFIGYLSDEAH